MHDHHCRFPAHALLSTIFCLGLSAVLGLSVQAQETRFHQYTKKFANPSNPAKVLAAGYLGGAGDEYLSAAAINGDGTVYLAGNALGPSFELKGTRIQVLGRDTAAPAFSMPSKGSGDKRKIDPPDWRHTAGAGFIVRLSKGEGSVAQAVRFPWGAGSITDMAADGQGGLYVTGVVGQHFANVANAPLQRPDGIEGPGELFVGRLKDDLSGFAWVQRLADDPQQPPKLRVLEGDIVAVMAVHAHHLRIADGQILRSQPGGLLNSWVGARDPRDFITATGTMRHTRTGYEPWRQPFLFIHDHDRNLLGHYYQWSSRLVGMNWSRLVSDSEIRGLNFDRTGNLLIYGWSDGGNSVLEFAPYDIKAAVRQAAEAETGRKTGLGFSTWGAGVGSFAHIIRIDPRTGAPLAKANFISYLSSKNKPSSVSIATIDPAVDDSVLLSGSSAYGLIETASNKVNALDHEKGDYIGGTFVAILNEALSDIRFSSAIPGAAQVKLARYSKKEQGGFATASARVGDKTRVVFLSGARQHEKFKPHNALQAGFGGGDLDGLYVVLEMDTLEDEMLPHSGGTTALSAAPVPDTGKESSEVAGEFKVSAGMNRDHSLIVMRDGGHRKWPVLYMAKPQGDGSIRGGSGQFVLHGAGDSVEMGGTLTARENHLGAHLGKMAGDEFVYPEIKLAVTVQSSTQATVQLSYNQQSLSRQASISLRPSKPAGKGINVRGVLELTKKDLGLAQGQDDAQDPIYIEFWAPGRP